MNRYGTSAANAPICEKAQSVSPSGRSLISLEKPLEITELHAAKERIPTVR